MGYEVMSGEVSKGLVKEDIDVATPPDIQGIEVDPAVVDNVADRNSTLGVDAGGKPVGVPEVEKGDSEIEQVQGSATDSEDQKDEEPIDISTLTNEELKDLVTNLNEAVTAMQGELGLERKMFDKLSEQYIKLESYTLKAEQVVEHDKTAKEKSQREVTEAVSKLKEYIQENSVYQKKTAQLEEYARKLEEQVIAHAKLTEAKKEVKTYLENAFCNYPHLTAFKKEISTATSITEANELINKYNSLKGKIRVDKVLKESVSNTPVKRLSEGREKLAIRGML